MGEESLRARAWLIGSAPVCDIVVPETTVSRRHCRLSLAGGAYTIEDLGSANGTFVNGQRINTPVRVEPNQFVTLGRKVMIPWDQIFESVKAGPAVVSLRPGAKIIRIGRSPDNDIVLDHPGVSSHHAHVIPEPNGFLIEDLGSANGTALNSAENKIRRAPLGPNDHVFFGSHKVAASLLLNSGLLNSGAAAGSPGKTVVEESDTATEWKPEIASVLFTDIVGFTRLNPTQQVHARMELESCVTAAAAYKNARSERAVIARPTGDGMALVFFTHPSTAAECAVQVARMIREKELSVRLGINQGTVYRLKDINGNDDVNGNGINMAQRVMDCGDAGHILISASVAEALKGTMVWHEFVHPIGSRRIKHGDLIEVYSLSGPDFGRIEEPARRD